MFFLRVDFFYVLILLRGIRDFFGIIHNTKLAAVPCPNYFLLPLNKNLHQICFYPKFYCKGLQQRLIARKRVGTIEPEDPKMPTSRALRARRARRALRARPASLWPVQPRIDLLRIYLASTSRIYFELTSTPIQRAGAPILRVSRAGTRKIGAEGA